MQKVIFAFLWMPDSSLGGTSTSKARAGIEASYLAV